jgi:Helix-turn-helix domain
MTQANREARKAALKRVLARRDDIIIPKHPVEIPDEDPSELLERVEKGYMELKIGALLEDARKTRDIGKRELARSLGTTHGRISTLEKAQNLELKSITEVAGALGFDVQVTLVSREDGATLGTTFSQRHSR